MPKATLTAMASNASDSPIVPKMIGRMWESMAGVGSQLVAMKLALGAGAEDVRFATAHIVDVDMSAVCSCVVLFSHDKLDER